jgi:hypothetical protein
MAIVDRILGQDLDLGFLPNEEGWRQAGPHWRNDLQPVLRADVTPRETDLAVVDGRANLVQSLLLRLKTERGELAPLGYPDYGSRHLALVGERNTETTRNLIALYLLECLRQEPRIERVKTLKVTPGVGNEDRDKVDIKLEVVVRGEPSVLSVVVPFSLQPLP